MEAAEKTPLNAIDDAADKVASPVKLAVASIVIEPRF